MMIMHFVAELTIGISIILAIATVAFVPVFIATYQDVKKFYMEFGDSGIIFKCRRKTVHINYSDLKLCGLIRRAGPTSIQNFSSRIPDTDSKSIFVFTTKANPDLKKIAWHMRTTTGVYHGYYKNIFCISDYRNSPLFRKCFEAVDIYCANFSVETINKDRLEL